MPKQRTQILDHRQIDQKITRIAHQIYENNFEEAELILVGIEPRGAILAQRLTALLRDLAPMEIRYLPLSVNKEAPLSEPFECALTTEEAEGKTVVLVDDVLNTGKVLMHAAGHLLDLRIKRLQTVCLVDRKHRHFPIRADYEGLTLATTLQEHISVEFGETDSAWLE
ncbi:MAG: phosphoribosyltransferase [Leptolyngbya sp. SIO3F4]|nr:phosphoribosyltransferase [Leptolyngbya sp. SIO3F4]